MICQKFIDRVPGIVFKSDETCLAPFLFASSSFHQGDAIFLGLLLLSQAIEFARDLPAMLELQVYPIFHQDNEAFHWVLPDTLIGLLFRFLVYLGLPICGALLCSGIRPRLVSLICFLVICSLQHYLTLFLQGGDVLLRLLSFWSIFLPDRQKSPKPEDTTRLSGPLAGWAFTLQMCFVYWFAAFLKNDPVWTQTGEALFDALSLEHFTTPFGLYLRQFRGLLEVLTFATRYFEFFGLFLLLVPVYQDRFRMLAVILFVSFHLIGMQSVLRVGIFPWVCTIAWIAFLPDFFWNWIAKKCPSVALWVPEDVPQPRRKAKRIPLQKLDIAAAALVMICLVDAFSWNIASLQREEGMAWMDQYDVFGRSIGLRQEWNMYAPHPRTVHGWLIVPANLTDGTRMDLFTGKEVSWVKPSDIGTYFGDDRWRRYLSNLFDNQNPETLQTYARYLIQQWNKEHQTKVQDLSIIFMKEETSSEIKGEEPQQQVLYFSS